MKEIVKRNLYVARNAEHYQFHDDALRVASFDLATRHGFVELREAYALLFEMEKGVFLRNKSFVDTEAIRQADKKRDELFFFLKQTAESNLFSPTPERKSAAEQLAFLMKPYRGAAKRPHAENTAQLSSLVSDLQKPECAQPLSLLGLTDVVQLLRAANEEFMTLYNNRSNEKLTRAEVDTMKELRLKVDEAFATVVKAINSLYQANELIGHNPAVEDELGRAIDSINALQLQLQQTLGLRTAGGGKEEEE
ncbi:MAG: DUF6261 family protein [Prevotellaceae bacterium]|jgi:hypothetical protein|nr:DUF6261 family protein [Prevotellaceae bacterium]